MTAPQFNAPGLVRQKCRSCSRLVARRNLFDPWVPLCWRCHLRSRA